MYRDCRELSVAMYAYVPEAPSRVTPECMGLPAENVHRGAGPVLPAAPKGNRRTTPPRSATMRASLARCTGEVKDPPPAGRPLPGTSVPFTM